MATRRAAQKTFCPLTVQSLLALVKSGDFSYDKTEIRKLNNDGGKWSEYVVIYVASPWAGDPYALIVHPLKPTEMHWQVKFVCRELGYTIPHGRVHTLVLGVGPGLLDFGSLKVDTDDGEVQFVYTDNVAPGTDQEERLRYLLRCLPSTIFRAASYVYRLGTRTATAGHVHPDLLEKHFEEVGDKMKEDDGILVPPISGPDDDDLV